MEFANMINNTFLGITIANYLYSLLIVAGALIIGKAFHFITSSIFKKMADKTATKLDDMVVEVIEKPLIFLIAIGGMYLALMRLGLEDTAKLFTFGMNTIQILFMLDMAWFVTRFIDGLIEYYIMPLTAKTETHLDDVLIPLLRKLGKAVVVVLTAISIVGNFGYDVSSVIAGLGIGGLAFALAAQDMLKNLFGGVSIIADYPFKIGDRIRIDNNDGHVKEIGLRTTKIVTLDGTQLIVPNSKISDSIIENVSREEARKVKMFIGLTYDTTNKKLNQAIKILEDIIKKNKHTKNDSIVAFDNFGDFSLNVLVIYWIKRLDQIMLAKNEVNLAIKEQLEKAKIDMAFPTQTIKLKKS